MEKQGFSGFFGCCFKADKSILNLSQIEDREVRERGIMHNSCIHHFLIGHILADLIGPTFCQRSEAEKRQTLFYTDSPYNRLYQRSDRSVHGAQLLHRLTGHSAD